MGKHEASARGLRVDQHRRDGARPTDFDLKLLHADGFHCGALKADTQEEIGDPGMTRTCDLRFRKPSLYPAELRDREPENKDG